MVIHQDIAIFVCDAVENGFRRRYMFPWSDSSFKDKVILVILTGVSFTCIHYCMRILIKEYKLNKILLKSSRSEVILLKTI